MLIVKKFGGSSVADKERIFNVAKRCIEDYEAGNDVVVVLSAMGKTTDHLIEMARDINPKASKREMDMLLATGEQTSVALMSMAMQALGCFCRTLNAFQVTCISTSAYSSKNSNVLIPSVFSMSWSSVRLLSSLASRALTNTMISQLWDVEVLILPLLHWQQPCMQMPARSTPM